MGIVKSCDLFDKYVAGPVRTSDGFLLYRKNRNRIIRIFPRDIIASRGKELDKRIEEAAPISGVIMPEDRVFTSEGLIGYTMEKPRGLNDIQYENSLSPKARHSLYRIAEKYLELERIVREAGDDVVFPNLLDRSNIFVGEDGKPIIVNYDKIQVGDSKAVGTSRSLGDHIDEIGKYHNGELFTKQLDIRSLIIYYFQMTLNINVGKILKDYTDNGLYVFNETLKHHGITNLDLQDKIWAIFNSRLDNEYLGKDVLWIADNYVLAEDYGRVFKLERKAK